jgi:hypothetical protein
MSNLYIDIAQTNETKHYRLYDSDFQESMYDDVGELYRALIKEYGRCVSKQYIGEGVQIGWVFEKRVKYDDVRAPKAFKHMTPVERDKCSFIMATWVGVHTEKPTKAVINHYAKF